MAHGKKKVHHWKHGWIPLDDFAREVVRKREAKSLADALGTQEKGGAKFRPSPVDFRLGGGKKDRKALADALALVKLKKDANLKITAADRKKHGVREGEPDYLVFMRPEEQRQWRKEHKLTDPADDRTAGSDDSVMFTPTGRPMTKAQKAEVKAVISGIEGRFPGLKATGPVYLEKDIQDGSWASTNIPFPNKLTLNSELWDNETAVKQQILQWSIDHGAIAGEADTPHQFRRKTIIHEMGHLIGFRMGHDHKGTALEDYANEPVTPRSMGYTSVAEGEDDSTLDEPTPRWTADSFDKKSGYAITSPYEWIAEGFLDGYENEDKASESGKKIYQIMLDVYGPEKGATT